MARGVNKVILIGNLGNDPEVRYTPNGSAVANVSLATSETWRDKQSGDIQEKTEWHRVVFFNRLAEIVGQYLRKGSKIYVEGSLRSRKWVDKNNIERYTTEIVANEMHMLDSRSAGAAGGEKFQANTASSQPQEPLANFTASAPHNTSSAPAAADNHFPESHSMQEPIPHDDIPF